MKVFYTAVYFSYLCNQIQSNMQIINPIYDSAFKYLMDNNQVAKLMISAIIGEEVEDLTLDATELKLDISRDKFEFQNDPVTFFTLLRIDFAARIKTADGTYKEVLIEIQKAKLPTDIMRFRRYLGERYTNENVSIEVDGHKKALPLLPIYFLGHPLDNCDASVLKINRQYKDVVTGNILETHEEFVENLTHNCFIIQIAKLKKRRRNDLEALLSIFDQDNISNDKHLLNVKEEEIPEKYRPILRRLLEAASEKKVRDGMNAEDEVLSELQTLEREIEKERKAKEEAEMREQEERKQKEEERKQKEEERKQKEAAIVNLFTKRNLTISEIATIFQMNEEKVKEIVAKN